MFNNKLPEKINPFKLALSEEKIAGYIFTDEMKRLESIWPQREGNPVDILLDFGFDEEQRCYIQGKINTEVTLECQRCLGIMNYHIEHEFCLTPVASEDNKIPIDRYEPILLVDRNYIMISQMVEDELLLTIPNFPKHLEHECEALKTT